MDNTEKYDLLAGGNGSLASSMGILPRSADFLFSGSRIKESLGRCPDFDLLSFKESKVELSGIQLQGYVAVIGYKAMRFDVNLRILGTEGLDLHDYGFANSIDDGSMTAASMQKYLLDTSVYFSSDPLASFHFQLKVMDAIVADASLVIDSMSYRLLSAKWLKLAAASSVPPSPEYLFTIHAVYDEDKSNGGKRQYWLHTHGLHRCGTVELEILNFDDGADQMNTLISMSVKKFLSDPPLEKEKFTIGYDGLGINLAWLRWEEALKEMPDSVLGGLNDRKGEGNVHAEPSGILLGVEDGEFVSPQIYNSAISENPIFYITTEETNRMSALAKERFPYFERAFDYELKKKEKRPFFKNLFAKQRNDGEEWSFLVKMGLYVGRGEAEDEREHLWFEVQAIGKGNVDGKLLNQPYWIDGLNEGDVKSYSLSLLTDWVIYSPDNTYTPDSSYLLDEVGHK
ncbi:MAG: hypothetical protein BGN96_16795 [Bacteroidales bacterium 45-6]|nr:MAG: hypothetical protein BGN96_16795 [Bacteroidales bacterium 45-6]